MRHAVPTLLTALWLLLPIAALAESPATVVIDGKPAGATITVDDTMIGRAPQSIAVPAGSGEIPVTVHADGYSDALLWLDPAAPPLALTYALDLRRTAIIVTVDDDRPPAPDGAITLREALLYARGDLTPAGRDRQAIDGPVGKGRADDVVVPEWAPGEPSFVFAAASLPPLDDPGDHLQGPPNHAIITQADTARIAGPGLSVSGDVSAANIEVDGFDIGFSASGVGSPDLANSSASGGSFGYLAADGAALVVSEASATVSLAPAVAVGGGTVEGVVDTPAMPDELTLFGGPAGAGRSTFFRGPATAYGQTALHVRSLAPVPLHAVSGFRYDASSYDAFRIIGAPEAFARYPSHVADGQDGDFFQWAYGDGPPDKQFMSALGSHPLRTSGFEIEHRPVEGSRLERYRFALLGRNGNRLWETTVDARPDRDVIAVDPNLDFFGYRIDIVAAQGGAPAIEEIHAEIIDSTTYAPRARSSKLLVFDRPTEGKRLVLELAGRLILLEENGFLPKHSFPSPYAPASPPARQDVAFDFAGKRASDFAAFIAALDKDRPASVALTGTLAIGADELQIDHPNLVLSGPARLEFAPDAPPLLITSNGRIEFIGITFSGGGIANSKFNALLVKDASFTGFDTGINLAGGGTLSVDNTVFSKGDRAIEVPKGGLFIARSTFADLDTAIVVRPSSAIALIDNSFERLRTALATPFQDNDFGTFALIANRWTDGADRRLTLDGPLWRESLLLGNSEAFAIPDEALTDARSSSYGAAAVDARSGDAPTAVRLVTLADPQMRCIRFRGPRDGFPTFTSQLLLLQDAPVELYCGKGDRWGHLAIPYDRRPASDDPGLPAAVGLDVTIGEPLWREAGLVDTLDIDIAERVLAEGPYPAGRGHWQRADMTGPILRTLVESGRYPFAFTKAWDETVSSPGPGSDRNLLYVANRWANALDAAGELDAAEAIYADLALKVPPLAGADALWLNAQLRIAEAHASEGAWEAARDMYDRILLRRPDQPTAQQNLRYVYQQWFDSVFDPANPSAALDFIAVQTAAHPSAVAPLTEVASVVLTNAAVGALDAGRPQDALPISRVVHGLAPSPTTRSNLIAIYQQYAIALLAAGDVAKPVAVLGELKGQFTDLPELDSIAVGAFGQAVEGALGRREPAQATRLALALRSAVASAEADNLLTYAYAKAAEQVLASAGLDAARDLLLEGTNAYPKLASLAEQAAAVVGDHGIGRYNAGDYAGAIASWDAALRFLPGDASLSQNILVAYSNWAVKEANAGNFAEARRIAKEGLARFPNDATLKDVIAFVGDR